MAPARSAVRAKSRCCLPSLAQAAEIAGPSPLSGCVSRTMSRAVDRLFLNERGQHFDGTGAEVAVAKAIPEFLGGDFQRVE